MTAITRLSTTGSNVCRSIVYPLGINKLSVLRINTNAEIVEYTHLHRVMDFNRTGDIVIEVYVKAVSSSDTTLGTIYA